MARYLFSIAIFMLTYAVTLADNQAYGRRCNAICENSPCDEVVFKTNCVQECIKVMKLDQCPEIEFQCSDYVVSGTKSCVNHCGSGAGQCWCDSICTALGDCCCDFTEECPAVVQSDPPEGHRTAWGKRCDELCATTLCNNAGFDTNCKQECIAVLKTKQCPGPQIDFNCYNYPSVANGNSCEGVCNGPASSCWCDSSCVFFNDCCCDISTQCPDL